MFRWLFGRKEARRSTDDNRSNMQYSTPRGSIPVKAVDVQVQGVVDPRARYNRRNFPHIYNNEEADGRTTIQPFEKREDPNVALFEVPVDTRMDMARPTAGIRQMNNRANLHHNDRARAERNELNDPGPFRGIVTGNRATGEVHGVAGVIYHPEGQPRAFDRARVEPLDRQGRQYLRRFQDDAANGDRVTTWPPRDEDSEDLATYEGRYQQTRPLVDRDYVDMTQQKSQEGSEPPRVSFKTFLHLPPKVRRKIYNEAGFVTGIDIVLRPRRGCEAPDRVSDECFRFTFSILQTCKAIHDEIKAGLFAENRLVIPYDTVDKGLSFLNQLSPHMCSALTEIFVELHMDAPITNLRSGPILAAILNRDRLALWQAAASHVLRYVLPRTLKLYLVCDTGYSPKTPLVLQPIVKSLTFLKDLELRLHPKRDPQLSATAKEVALQVTGLNAGFCNQPSRLFDLPRELRWQILQYTDLVTPNREICWDSQTGYSVKRLVSLLWAARPQ
ncbi:hypothetical protein FALBO_8620 [Fusarium albosuccineum]|uniref:Uncharacterized protein n=1 Tax=Fusarium albosuccineum TaxID=1237068 RepID=A0A8H4PJC6_9HYPO|nr:hypothetical protein FALBO_8620 [Fusarium albosuccineum]